MPLTPQETQAAVELALDFARQGMTDELVGFIEHGMPVNVADAQGNSLLMLAAYHGHAETVAALVQRGADVDRLNSRGQSPVAGAIFKGEDEVVRVLVAAGADLDHGQPTARATARMFGQEELIAEPPKAPDQPGSA